jgi:MFS family permease
MAPSPSIWRVGTLSYTTGGLLVLFGFLLLGDIAWSLKERAVPEVFKALLKEFQVGPILWNVLVGGLPALATLVIGPIVGVASDRYRSRLGRRIPFLLATTPFIFLGIAGMAFSLPLAALLGGDGVSTAALVVLALSWVVFEVATVIGNAMFTALIKDTVPDRFMGRFYGLFRGCSLLVGIVFFFGFFGNDILATSTALLMGIGAVYVVGFLALCWRVKEGVYPDPGPAPAFAGPVKIIRNSLDHRFYVVLFLVFALATVAFMPVNNNAFLAKDAFAVDPQAYGQALGITYCISLVLAYPIGWLTDRLHPLRTGFITLTAYGVIMAVGWIAVDDATTFTAVFIAHGVVSGAFFTSTASLLLRLLPSNSFSQRAAAKAAIAGIMTVGSTAALGGVLGLLGGDPQVVFVIGAGLAGLAALGWVVLLREFHRLGGYDAYQAPEGPTRLG